MHSIARFPNTLVIVALTLVARTAASQPPAELPPQTGISETRREDATLWDVHFADPDQGWVVGDLGVILHTRDGGENWIAQESGTSASLRGVHFVDSNHGWAVGGWYEPYTGLSRGVILRTVDGGSSWTPLANDLPALRQVARSPSGGWIVHGDWSHVHQGSVLETVDDGVNWSAFDQSLGGLPAAVTLGPDGVLLGDDQGVLFAATEVGRPPRTVAAGGRCGVLQQRGATAAAVWEDGTAGISRDGGRHWQRLATGAVGKSQPGDDPATVRHWQAIAISSAGTVWFAGAPGDQVLRCEADGAVEAAATAVHQPLYGLHFWDDYRGWAVGAFGTILTTRDGGETWRPQRLFDPRERRALVLAVAEQPQQLPWAAIGRESLEFGRRVAVAMMPPRRPPDDADPLEGDLLLKTRHAAARLGVSEVMRLPGGAAGVTQLSAALRSYRPGVVVIGRDMGRKARRRVVEDAMASGVARVYGVVDGETAAGDVTLHRAAILPVAGVLVADLWERALEILQPGQPLPERTVLRQLWDRTGAGAARVATDGLAGGLPALGGRWTVPNGRRRNLQVLQARSSEEVRLDRLMEAAAEREPAATRRALDLLVQQTPTAERSRLMRRILDRCRWQACEETSWTGLHVYLVALEYASDQFGDSPLGRWATLRRTAIMHSTEWKSMLEWGPPIRGHRRDSKAPPVASHGSPFERAERAARAQGVEWAQRDGAVEQAAAIDPSPPPAFGAPVATSADAAAETLYPAALYELAASDSLAWRLHPWVLAWKTKFGSQAMEGWDRSAWQQLGAAQSSGPWQALVEPSTADRLEIKRLGPEQTQLRPWLDGRLDDALWRAVPASPVGDGFTLRVAVDHEYYFLAIRGKFFDGDALAPAQQRRRDERLRDRARVCCEIDVDGDLLTRYVLTIDATGRTHDAVDGFPQWRPEWFVSTAVAGGVRTVEVAIDRRHVDRPQRDSPSVELRQAGGAADSAENAGAPLERGGPWRIRLSRLPAGEPAPPASRVTPAGWLTVEMATGANEPAGTSRQVPRPLAAGQDGRGGAAGGGGS